MPSCTIALGDVSVVIGTLVGMVEWLPPEPRELPAIREDLANQMRSPYEQQVLTELLQGGKGTLSPHTGDVSRDAAMRPSCTTSLRT